MEGVRSGAAARIAALIALGGAVLLSLGAAPAFAQTGSLVICASSSNGMAGRPFEFAIDDGRTFAVRGGRCSAAIDLPAGPVTVTQLEAHPPTRVVSITATPGAQVVGTRNLAQRHMAVRISEGRKTTIRFTNQAAGSTGTGGSPGAGLPPGSALGKLQICKRRIRADLEDDSTTPEYAAFSAVFTFRIQRVTAHGTPTGGTATVKVRSGTCAPPMLVPTGDYRVTELDPGGTGVSANYELIAIEVIPPENELRRNLIARSVDVRVLFAQDTTVVFENRIRRAYVKVCKEVERGSETFLGGRTFTFSIETDTGEVVIVAVRPGECSLPQGPFPVLNPQTGAPNNAQVEEASDPTKFFVSDIRVQQSRGIVFRECATDQSGTQRCVPRVRFRLGGGVNIVHFENTAVPDP